MSMKNDPIRHVVLLMLENRSFDHMLGDFTRVDPMRAVAGIDPQNPFSNTFEGKSYSQAPCAEQKLPNSVFWSFDPKHEHANVRKQMGSLTMPTMAGFVEDAIGELRKHYDPRRIAEQVMGYFPVLDGTSPTGAIHDLARHFTICDHWFSSVPGPTWVNRFFALCGTAEGHLAMPDFSWTGIRRFHPYGMDTIFGRLRAKGRSARIFQDGVPGLTMLLSDVLRDPGLFGGMDEFELLAQGKENKFPEFVFIEPDFFWPGQSDQHPPSDVAAGDALIARVYNALRGNTALWDSTLFVVTYDEHGGFCDHVPPGPTIAPDGSEGDDDQSFDFTRLGVRVPTLLITPHLPKASVDSTVYDHTSLLAYLCSKWDLAPLGARCAAAMDPKNAVAHHFGGKFVANAFPNAPTTIQEGRRLAQTRAISPSLEGWNDHQRQLSLAIAQLHSDLGLSSDATKRGALRAEPVSADDTRQKAQDILRHLKKQPKRGKGAALTAAIADSRAGGLAGVHPLKVLMVHGVGHGDDPTQARWKDAWQQAFVQSARAAGHAHAEKIEFVFAQFDNIFERYPLDAETIARGVYELEVGMFGPPPVFERARDLRGLVDLLRWTAGMTLQWVENKALRTELSTSLLDQINASHADIICAHSLGAMACYDCLRQEIHALGGAAFDDTYLVTFGTQIANRAVRRVFGGRIEPLYDQDGHGIRNWFNLFNPLDRVFTCPLPGEDGRTHSLIAEFDILGDLLNHDGDRYLSHSVMVSTVLPAVLGTGDRGLSGVTRAPSFIPPRRNRRRALLVGINDYPDPKMQLNGCVNDVYLMSAVLQECGFEPDEIRALTDRRATRAGLLERLDWLTEGVCAGDERVLFYSGHGAQIPVYGADGTPTKMCETLVPVDFDWSLEHAFTDREFLNFYSQLPYGSNFVSIIDCCHAGGMSRGALRVRGIDPPDDVRHRALRWNPEHQMWVPRDFVEAASIGRRFALDATSRSNRPSIQSSTCDGMCEAIAIRPGTDAAYKSAKQDYGHEGPYVPTSIFAAGREELAAEYEHGSVSYGAFTFALAKQLRASRTAPSFRNLITRVRSELRRLGYQQRPTVSGPRVNVDAQVPIFRWKLRGP